MEEGWCGNDTSSSVMEEGGAANDTSRIGVEEGGGGANDTSAADMKKGVMLQSILHQKMRKVHQLLKE